MSGGWANSGRRERLPDNWPELREATKRRAGGRCEFIVHPPRGGRFRCPRPGTDCDHVERGDDDSPTNLMWLCGPHHAVKSSAEGNAAQAAQRSRGRRSPEPHPGRIRRAP